MIEIDPQLAREALRIAGRLRMTGRGGSMGPWIRSGDPMVVEPLGSVAAGEILVFERGGQLVAHRVLRVVSEGRWLTRGDSVEGVNDLVQEACAVGRVRGLHLRWFHIEHPPPWLRRAVGRAIAKASPSINRLRRVLRTAVPPRPAA